MSKRRFVYCPMCAEALGREMRGGRERGICPTCKWVDWDNPTPVVAAVVEHEGDVILARNHGWPETWFGLITGFLERDESPELGILREVEEELGLTGEIAGFIGNYAFGRMHQVILAYHVVATGEVVVGDELAAIKRVPPHKLRPWPFGTGDAVRDWLASRSAATPDAGGTSGD